MPKKVQKATKPKKKTAKPKAGKPKAAPTKRRAANPFLKALKKQDFSSHGKIKFVTNLPDADVAVVFHKPDADTYELCRMEPLKFTSLRALTKAEAMAYRPKKAKKAAAEK